MRLWALPPALCLAAAAGPALAFGPEAGEQGLPLGWQELRFRRVERPTRYRLAQEDGNWFVRAESSASASGLLKAVAVDLARTPVLSWRWRIAAPLKGADARRKDGDDFAARVYVAFGRFRRFPRAALNYVWDNRHPVGARLDNAYAARNKMVVVESGGGKAGRWVAESRDVLADYRASFGGEPPPVLFVAVMTDTDDTRESATADYDDIDFGPAAGPR